MTLYTSVTDQTAQQKRALLDRGIRYLTAAILTAAAGAVYELFSHGVYSYFMIYAFMVPLAGGVLPSLLALRAAGGRRDVSAEGGTLSSGLQFAAIITLTAGSFMKGILDIYGTTNRLMAVYTVLGLMLLTASVIAYIVRSWKSHS